LFKDIQIDKVNETVNSITVRLTFIVLPKETVQQVVNRPPDDDDSDC